MITLKLISNGLGSMPVYARNLARELSRSVDLEVLTNSPEVFSDVGNVAVRESAPLSITRNVARTALSIMRHRSWMNRTYGKSDIVATINPFEAVVSARFRQVMVVHDLTPMIFPGKYPLSYRYYKYVLPLAIRSSWKVITPSENTRNDLLRLCRVPEDKISVIHNGIGNELDGIEDAGARAKLSKRINGNYILHVGGQSYHKNIITLLRAYKLLRKRCREKLVLAGAPSRRTHGNLVNFCRKSDMANDVIFLGHVSMPELSWLYKNARVFVFPSLYEGFGLPPLEAMSQGIPVVASSASSVPEVCGDAAFYINPEDPDVIAEGIYQALVNQTLRKNLIKGGYERIRVFSWANTAKGFLTVFEEMDQPESPVPRQARQRN